MPAVARQIYTPSEDTFAPSSATAYSYTDSYLASVAAEEALPAADTAPTKVPRVRRRIVRQHHAPVQWTARGIIAGTSLFGQLLAVLWVGGCTLSAGRQAADLDDKIAETRDDMERTARDIAYFQKQPRLAGWAAQQGMRPALLTDCDNYNGARVVSSAGLRPENVPAAAAVPVSHTASYPVKKSPPPVVAADASAAELPAPAASDAAAASDLSTSDTTVASAAAPSMDSPATGSSPSGDSAAPRDLKEDVTPHGESTP